MVNMVRYITSLFCMCHIYIHIYIFIYLFIYFIVKFCKFHKNHIKQANIKVMSMMIEFSFFDELVL